MYFLWVLIGAVLLGVWERSLFATLVGALLGLLWARQSHLAKELRATRARWEELATRERRAVAEPSPIPVASSTSSIVPGSTVPPSSMGAEAPPVRDTSPLPPAIKPQAWSVDALLPAESRDQTISMEPAAPRGPSAFDQLWQRVWGWFTEGNVPVKVGMLVLFAGVAALLKYASDSGMLRVPVGLRVSMVALAAIAALGFGWRQRTQRRVFALSLQGGAIGVLLITIFAAFRLYDLVPATAAFALLILLVAGIGMLAVLQEALALAVLGLLAGFVAPILVSTGNGSHVALFSYYAMLNVAVLGIAWVRSWRVLNLLGFVATFGIGTAWGVLRYEPALFASTEPFLILNFLFYLAIPWLYLLRAPSDRRKVVDGSLLFGNPLVSLVLQGALLDWHGQELAFSALAAAAIYVLVAFSVRHRGGLGLLRDAWAVLAVAFATLAVPLALSANLTGSVFALEGAGLVWLGFRQQRALSRWGGLALQLFAALALMVGRAFHPQSPTIPVLNSECVGLLLLVIAALASCAFYARWGSAALLQRITAVLLYAWGLAWWIGAASIEVDRFGAPQALAAIWLALLAFTAWLAGEATRRQPRYELGLAIAFTVPALFLTMLPLVIYGGVLEQQPLWGWGLLGVMFAAVLGWRTLICLRTAHPWIVVLAQLTWLWRWGLIFASAIAVCFASSRWMSLSWYVSLTFVPLLLLFVLTLYRSRWIAPPPPSPVSQWRMPMLHSLMAVLLILGAWALLQDGDASPLRYLPLFNPLELLLLVIGLCLAAWLDDAATPHELRRWRSLALGAFVMLFATSATLRGVHQLVGVPWSDALSRSSLAQMSLTLVWSVLGLLAWVWGSRRGQRLVWLAGAATMTVVLAKLLLIDRVHLGNLFGIASFIAYGLLCTVIGYLAPAPPKRPLSSTDEEATHAP